MAKWMPWKSLTTVGKRFVFSLYEDEFSDPKQAVDTFCHGYGFRPVDSCIDAILQWLKSKHLYVERTDVTDTLSLGRFERDNNTLRDATEALNREIAVLRPGRDTAVKGNEIRTLKRELSFRRSEKGSKAFRDAPLTECTDRSAAYNASEIADELSCIHLTREVRIQTWTELWKNRQLCTERLILMAKGFTSISFFCLVIV